MSKTPPKSTTTTIRDSKSGRLVTVKGLGALKGKMKISKNVDLTKPISGPASSGKWSLKGGSRSAGESIHGKGANRTSAKC